MTLTPWTADDFADSFQRHMPTGPVWPRDPDTTQRAAVAALMPTYVRSWALACELPVETLPASATHLLPEWEASLGLPDPCAGPDPTIAQRQRHVVARLTQQNGPSIPSLIAFAAALGFTITIQEYAPARYGRARYGDLLYGRDWAFAWKVTEANGEIVPAVYGSARYGDRYRTWGNAVLECELRRIAPAHTILLFAYADAPIAAVWGGSPGFGVGTWAA